MNKTFKVERKGKQTWVTVRQMPHDPQYTLGSRIPGLATVIEIRATEEGPYLPCSYCGSTFHQPPCPYEPVAPQWIGTEPCYAAETNAHITAFMQRHPEEILNRAWNHLWLDSEDTRQVGLELIVLHGAMQAVKHA